MLGKLIERHPIGNEQFLEIWCKGDAYDVVVHHEDGREVAIESQVSMFKASNVVDWWLQDFVQ